VDIKGDQAAFCVGDQPPLVVFCTPDRVIVISGDTAPTEAMVEASLGCDVLLHEVYSAVRFQERSPVCQR